MSMGLSFFDWDCTSEYTGPATQSWNLFPLSCLHLWFLLHRASLLFVFSGPSSFEHVRFDRVIPPASYVFFHFKWLNQSLHIRKYRQVLGVCLDGSHSSLICAFLGAQSTRFDTYLWRLYWEDGAYHPMTILPFCWKITSKVRRQNKLRAKVASRFDSKN